jgi:para-nitrobenzyl esterase
MPVIGSREPTLTNLNCGRVRFLVAAALCATAFQVFPSNAAATAISQATVTGGVVAGTVDPASGVATFKGIPFAAPPVGNLRWKAPQPVIPWTGVRKADAFAESCPEKHDETIRGSEDCLFLNIWTNAQTRHEKRPVMVWIYGGAFNGGTTANPTFDGTHFARDGVVLVSIAYRVGVLGFMANPDLSRESGNGSGAYGLQDQIAALRWVKDNISEFGGDPDRVTIFGQSAGGISVHFLTAAPTARGLFRYVISESGGAILQPPRTDTQGGSSLQSLGFAESVGARFLQSINAPDLAHARQIPMRQLLEAATRSPPWYWWAVIDGAVLPGTNYDLYQHGRFTDTPILIGYNSDDRHEDPPSHDTVAWFEDYVTHVHNQCPSMVRAILAAYPHRTDTEAFQAYRDLFLDTWYGGNTWTWARMHDQYGHSSTYVYYFDIHPPDKPGAFHADELPYVFGNFDSPPQREAVKISTLMRRYWINFATTGDPNGPGLPTWPRFTGKAPNAMVIDPVPSGRRLPHVERMKTVEQYYACVRSKL